MLNKIRVLNEYVQCVIGYIRFGPFIDMKNMMEQIGQNQRLRVCFIHFARWWHLGRSLPSLTASSSTYEIYCVKLTTFQKALPANMSSSSQHRWQLAGLNDLNFPVSKSQFNSLKFALCLCGSFMKIYNTQSKEIANYCIEMFNVQTPHYAITIS